MRDAASNFYAEQNVLIFDGFLKIALAEAEARAGDVDRAVSGSWTKRAGGRATGLAIVTFDAELHRARGEHAAEA